ncbi:MAG: hypothetical protein LBH82_00700, partial [Bacteroidales bacterium]|nr:hypothetical protein [Bacteroidales bacterium]
MKQLFKLFKIKKTTRLSIVFACLFLTISPALIAQVSHGGKPHSFQKSLSLQRLQPEKMPYQDNDLLMEKEKNLSEAEIGFT